VSYQVIARKYRPQRFADVVGQEHVTTTLSNAIIQKRIAHAFLFCGPRGTGKTTIARIFAKCLNATNGPTVDFAVDDPKCLEIAEGRSMDVLEIDGASNNGVEQVRELRETVKYVPASSRFKIYIIDEVHMLSTAAFNALLKTLEEPPAHVKFMFATTEPEKILATILSRCQRFDLRRIPLDLIAKHIAAIAGQEQVKVDDAALHAIARGADGCMRDAESTLDQLISFCGDQIEETDVLSMFGLTARAQLAGLGTAVLTADNAAALRLLNELASGGKDLSRLLSDLLNHFRNVLVFQVSQGDLSLLEVSEAEVTVLKEHAAMANTGALNRVLEVFTDAEGRYRDAASRKILLEVTLMKAMEAVRAVSLDQVLQTLQGLRSGAATPVALPASAAATTPVRTTPPTSVSRAAAPPPAPVEVAVSPVAADDLEGLWGSLLGGVERASKFTHTYLLQAHPVSFTNNLLTIGFDPEFEDQMGLADNARTHEVLQTKLRELGHPGCQIKFVKAEAPVGRGRPQPEAAPQPSLPAAAPRPPRAASAPSPAKEPPTRLSQDDFKNDPLIQKALEMFKGQIVKVGG
jgi:DNA polymerase-3 subunit gamma/tau